MSSIKTAEFWEQFYQDGTTRWDLGRPAPAFVDLLTSPSAPKSGRVAVLGCGRGYEALLFSTYGFEVVGFDFAPSAVVAATALAKAAGSTAQFVQQDIFDLSPQFWGGFDYVLEHTCYCAIDPTQRSAYVQVVQTLLHSQGELIGLFWAHDRPGGPPYGTTLAEIRQQFETNFEVLLLSPVTHSVPERQGEEYLAQFRVRGGLTTDNRQQRSS